jgi:hypothetical protein
MSRKNKVNPGQYTQAGRLSPDDAARERSKDVPVASERSGSGQKAASTGISNRESAAEEQAERNRLPRTPSDARSDDDVRAGGSETSGAADQNEQSSSKHGSRSEAQKAAESKYVDRPHPASEKTDGAFGRESRD